MKTNDYKWFFIYLPIPGYRSHGEVEGLPLPYYVDKPSVPYKSNIDLS